MQGHQVLQEGLYAGPVEAITSKGNAKDPHGSLHARNVKIPIQVTTMRPMTKNLNTCGEMKHIITRILQTMRKKY